MQVLGTCIWEYQVIERAGADGADEVDHKLNHEDGNEKGRHGEVLSSIAGHEALEGRGNRRLVFVVVLRCQ